jgi:hypothetical protein
VRELNGGKSDIPFSYRIVAKNKGYEDVRLAKVKEETLTAMTTGEEDVKKNEAIGGRRKVKSGHRCFHVPIFFLLSITEKWKGLDWRYSDSLDHAFFSLKSVEFLDRHG